MKKFTSKYYSGILVTITLFYVVSCEDLSSECVDLTTEIIQCSSKVHFPDKCELSRESELFKCAESVAQKLPQCTDDVARKLIRHYVTAYKQSDSIICDRNLHKEFFNNRECFVISQPLVIGMAFLTPGFVTDKGCKFFKMLSFLSATHQSKMKCYKLAKDYLDAMYSKSICHNAEIEMPTRDDFRNILSVLSNIAHCWSLHRNISQCGTNEKSRRVQCIEDEVLNKINNTQMKYLEDNILMTTKKTDEVLCANEKLRQDFKSNPMCIRFYMFHLQLLLLTEINGFYTEEGCEGVRYKEEYKFSIFRHNCRPVLREYWTEMKKVLPCVAQETPAAGDGAEEINGALGLVCSVIVVWYINEHFINNV